MIKYNDYELLYLIYEGDDIAYEELCNKYLFLIKKRLKDFKIKNKNFDDFVQEGLMVLDKAIKTYDEYKGKSFNKYFDFILQRKIMYLIGAERQYFYNVQLLDYDSMITTLNDINSFIYEDAMPNNLGNLEKQIYKYINEKVKPSQIAKELGIDIKKVYNTIYRLKIKFH